MRLNVDHAPRRHSASPDLVSLVMSEAGRSRLLRLLFWSFIGSSLIVILMSFVSWFDMQRSELFISNTANLLAHMLYLPVIAIGIVTAMLWAWGQLMIDNLSYDVQSVLRQYVPTGAELPAVQTRGYVIHVETLPTFTPNASKLAEIRQALNSMLSDDYSLSEGVMNESETEYTFRLIDLLNRRINADEVSRDELGADFKLPIMQGVTAPFGHMAVAGLTGSGKSRFMNWILTVASSANEAHTPTDELDNQSSVNNYIFALDAKNADLASLKYVNSGRHYPNGASVGINGFDALRIAQLLVDKMVTRQTVITKYGASNGIVGATWKDLVDNAPEMRPVWLFADELGSWTDILDKKESELFKKLIGRLLREGRSAGVFVVAATQNPNVNVLGFAGDQRQQYTAKFFLGYGNNKTNLAMMFGGVEDYPKLPVEPFGVGYYTVEGVANTPEVILTPDMTDFNFDFLSE